MSDGVVRVRLPVRSWLWRGGVRGVGVYLWVAAEHVLVPVGRRGLAITHICSCKQPLMDGWRCPGAL